MSELIYEIITKPDIAVPHVIGRGILPSQGKLIIAGPPKSNKSWLVMNLAIALARGVTPFGAIYKNENPVFPVYNKSKVLYIEMEMGEQGIRDRLKGGLLSAEQAIGLNLYVTSRDSRLRADTDEGRALLEQEVASTKPDVVIGDTLAKLHGADENDAKEMGNVLRFGDYLCDKYKTAIIWIHHTSKPGGDDKSARRGGDRLRGSSAIFADADTVILADRTSSEDSLEPLIDLTFELRRGEPLRKQTVQRLRTGEVIYIGEDFVTKEARAVSTFKVGNR